MNSTSNTKTHALTQTAFISVLIILLQLISALLIKLGFFSFSLVLVPVVVGGILMGPKYGAVFGGIFGIVVVLFCITGLDSGGFIIFNSDPLMCFIMCMTKGILCGFIPALIYKILYNLCEKKYRDINVIIVAVLSPIINTSVFVLFMFIFFRPLLTSWAGGTDILTYVITGLVGINFIIEFLLNIIICPVIMPSLLKSRYVQKLIK